MAVLGVLLALCAPAGQAQTSDPVILETSPSNNGAPDAGGIGVQANPAGVTFRLTQPVQVSAMGAALHRLGATTQTPYIALYAVGTPNSGPDVVNDSRLLATGLLPVTSNVAVDIEAAVNEVLEPGWYALTVGSGRYGATVQTSSTTLTNTHQGMTAHTRGPYVVNATSNSYSLQGVDSRLFLRGQTLPPLPAQPGFHYRSAPVFAAASSALFAVDPGHAVATRFELTQATAMHRVAGWFSKHGNGSVYAAILALPSVGASLPEPGTPAFTDAVVASTVFNVVNLADEYSGSFNGAMLPPGAYALVLGSGALGATGSTYLLGIDPADAFVACEAWDGISWFTASSYAVQMTLDGPSDVLFADGFEL